MSRFNAHTTGEREKTRMQVREGRTLFAVHRTRRIDAAEMNDLFRRRFRLGDAAITAGSGRRDWDDDDMTAASDAISNILTAVFGKPHPDNGGIQELLDRAHNSYLGDAEDYAEDPPEGV